MKQLSAEDLINKIVRTHNKVIYTGDKLASFVVKRIPSGVFTFDYFTDGGIPKGRLIQFHGARSSGKTTFAYKIINSFLSLYPDYKSVIVDFEHSFEYDWAKNFIKDMDRVILVKPDFGEQGIDFIKELATAYDVGLIVVDSIGSMIPVAEVVSSATDDFVGLQAKLVNKLLRKLVVIMSDRKKQDNELTVLLINQVRANIGVRSFQPQTAVPGGKMLEHLVSMDIKFYIKNYEKSKDIPFRCTVGFKIEKNKVGLPSMSGEFKMYINKTQENNVGDVIEDEFIFEMAKRHNIINRTKGRWFFKGFEFDNQVAVMQKIETDIEFKELLKSEILNVSKLHKEIDESDEVVEDIP